MQKTLTTIVVLVFVVVGILFFVLNSKKSEAPAPYETPAYLTPATATTPSPDKVEVKEFTITGTNFSFTPSTITVKKGDKVKIIFKNTNGFHDFVIDELKVATKRIKTGEEETISFTADKVGTFEYYCSVGDHRMLGMKGVLKVE